MDSCGDYDYQVLLLELLFRMCTKRQINQFANDFFPEAANIADSLRNLDRNNFDAASRIFLNTLNSQREDEELSILSIKSQFVRLGQISVTSPPSVITIPVFLVFDFDLHKF